MLSFAPSIQYRDHLKHVNKLLQLTVHNPVRPAYSTYLLTYLLHGAESFLRS